MIALKLFAGGFSSRADVIALLGANPTLDRADLAALRKRYGLTSERARVLADCDEDASDRT